MSNHWGVLPLGLQSVTKAGTPSPHSSSLRIDLNGVAVRMFIHCSYQTLPHCAIPVKEGTPCPHFSDRQWSPQTSDVKQSVADVSNCTDIHSAALNKHVEHKPQKWGEQGPTLPPSTFKRSVSHRSFFINKNGNRYQQKREGKHVLAPRAERGHQAYIIWGFWPAVTLDHRNLSELHYSQR